ncbi:MAG: amidase [SAR202 cluster bacterium]|nr:amidase [SAR202 cluster bacterium]
MSFTDEIAYIDATAQAELVTNGEVTPMELVDAAIERVEYLNPQINAVVTKMYDHARDTALRSDHSGSFGGVPFLVKDFLAEYAGIRFTEASKFLKGFVPDADSELVRRYKNAGLITIGKTNAPEFAIGATTEPELFGPTHNPWDLGLTPGGSSGGAAAAVASGMVPMAHGNDAGGSIRIPAACCGVFGLKPTRGRVPLGPQFGDVFGGLVAEHALTRSVRDSATLLDAVSGSMLGDPHIAPAQLRPFVDEAGTPPGRLVIAFSTESPTGTDVHPECIKAVEETVRLCEELGHKMVEAAPVYDSELLWKSVTTSIAVGVAWTILDWERRLDRRATEDDVEPFIWVMRDRGRQIGAPEYLLIQQDLQRITREVTAFFLDHDLWLTPTLGQPPMPLGSLKYTGGDPFEVRRKQASFSPFTQLSNATGQPSMSVPLYWSGDDLPIGIHFLGRFGDEATMFRLAGQLELSRPWASRRPPVSI